MYKFIKHLFAIITLVCVPAYSIAANYSWIDNTMPEGNNGVKATTGTTKAIYLTGGCFKLSCYEDAFSWVGNYGKYDISVQPLTSRGQVVKSALDKLISYQPNSQYFGFMDDVINVNPGASRQIKKSSTNSECIACPSELSGCNDIGPVDGSYLYNNVYGQSSQYEGEGAHTQYSSDPSPGQAVSSGGGSSSMQGLLWSWRMLSNKWTGVWAGKSAYETAYEVYGKPGVYETSGWSVDGAAINMRKTELPSPSNGKHIIIMSDGLDNDGPGEIVNGKWSVMEKTYTVKNSSGVTVSQAGWAMEITNSKDLPFSTYSAGGKKWLPVLKYDGPSFTMGVCDAHKPFTSITAAEYNSVCTALKDQGIKVHVIYTGTGTNTRLQNCANTTGGLYLPLTISNQASVVAKLNQIFTTVSTGIPQQIKIVDVPEGF